MSYVSTEQVKEVRNLIKKVMPVKDGFKFSVTREHYSTVKVAIMKSPIEFPKGYDQVNHFYFNRSESYSAAAKGVLSVVMEQINKVMGSNTDRNAGDMSADYSDFNYHVNLHVGKWDKDCEFVK